MTCSNCGAGMVTVTLDANYSLPVEIDLCTNCHAFWFDKYESLKLSPGSTLKLMKYIGENSAAAKAPISDNLHCPRCEGRLLFTNDLQRNTRFTYWRCPGEHGRFITFFQFLREKDFIRPLSRKQIEELRRNVQTVNCSNCGAPIDLTSTSDCKHCGSPLSMLDMKRPQELLDQLKAAAEPRPIDPALAFDLLKAKREVEIMYRPLETGPGWWNDVSSFGLVQAGLSAVARWLDKPRQI